MIISDSLHIYTGQVATLLLHMAAEQVSLELPSKQAQFSVLRYHPNKTAEDSVLFYLLNKSADLLSSLCYFLNRTYEVCLVLSSKQNI